MAPAFLRRFAELQAYALAGDDQARRMLGEYGLARWCGCSPEQALALAESWSREENDRCATTRRTFP